MLKKVMKVLMSVLCTMEFVGTKVIAEEPEVLYPTITQDTGSLTVRYFDDSEETIAAEGTEFTVYQIATIGSDLDTNGKYLYLSENVSIEVINAEHIGDDLDELADMSHNERLEYKEKVVTAYKNGEITDGYTATGKIGSSGEYKFDGLPTGLYFVVETGTTRYHVTSEPFVVSVPESVQTDAGVYTWNFNVVCNPKQIVAGDLQITKVMKGKRATSGDTFHVTIEFATGASTEIEEAVETTDIQKGLMQEVNEMSFQAKLGDGSTATVKSGDELSIKGGQTIIIYDVPAGLTYKVTEKEANQRPYDTTYENKEGVIKEKSSVTSTVINNSSRYDTGAGDKMVFWLMGGGTALALLVVLIVTKRKKDSKDDNEEKAE